MGNNISQKSLDIIIINYNNFEATKNCIHSIQNTHSKNVNILVVDNNSSDCSVKMLKDTFPDIEIIQNPENLGYAFAVNRGFSYSNSEIVIISNNDVIYQPESIKNLVEPFNLINNIGVLGPQQIYPDGKWQYSYGSYPGIKTALLDLFFFNYISHIIKKIQWNLKINNKDTKEVEYIDGAVMAINRAAFNDVNGFDEDYFFYTEEADFCYRLRKKGWKIIFNPNSEVIHERGGSTSRMGLNQKNVNMFINSKIRFCKKYLNEIETNLFIVLEIIHHFILAQLFKSFDSLLKGKINFIAQKKLIFSNLLDGWRNVKRKSL